jgi:hypothetical protein
MGEVSSLVTGFLPWQNNQRGIRDDAAGSNRDGCWPIGISD